MMNTVNLLAPDYVKLSEFHDDLVRYAASRKHRGNINAQLGNSISHEELFDVELQKSDAVFQKLAEYIKNN